MNGLFLLGAPAAVVGALFLLHDVFAVFAIYHLGFCLLLPALLNLGLRRRTMSDHLAQLALTGPGTVRGLSLGLLQGAGLAAAMLLFFRLLGSAFLAEQDIPEALAAWGVNGSNLRFLFWFMVLFNAPAEELYWRGFVHSELSGRRSRPGAILLTAGCYASYHGVTVYLLVPNPVVAALFMSAILAAGVGWGWLREKTGSVWPALLGHAGAAAGYMVAAGPFLER